MKKILLIFSSIIATSSIYSDVETKLKGVFDFRASSISETKTDEGKNLTNFRKDHVLNSNAAIKFMVSNDLGDVKYGMMIAIRALAKTKSSASWNGSHLYVESNQFGKICLGNANSASDSMELDASSISYAVGTGFTGHSNAFKYAALTEYDMLSSILSSKSSVQGMGIEPARNITYYSPKFNDMFQFGITYTPDSSNTGSYSPKNDQYSVSEVSHIDDPNIKYSQVYAAKDLISVGITNDYNINNDLSLHLAFTFDYGKAVQKKFNNGDQKNLITLTGDEKMSNLFAYNIGAKLSYNNISILLSYADLGKSFTSKAVHGNNRKTYYYSAGLAYGQGDLGASITYMHTNKRKNKMNFITLGTEYSIFPGLKSYAEVTFFKGKPSKHAIKKSEYKKDVKGTSFLIGTKLSI